MKYVDYNLWLYCFFLGFLGFTSN